MTVNQTGSRLARPRPGIDEHDERRHEQELVGHRIEPGAELRLLTGPPRDQAVEAVGRAGRGEHHQRPAEMPIQHQNHEGRNQQHSEQRQLIRRREHRHRALFPRTAAAGTIEAMRSMAVSASLPVTGAEG